MDRVRRPGVGDTTTVLAIVAVLTVAGVASYYYISVVTEGAELYPVKIGVSKTITHGAFYIGEQKGFFQRQGINATLAFYNTDSALLAAVGSGQSDVSISSPVAIADAISSGAKISIIGATQDEFPAGAAVLVRPNSTIANAAQLAGKKVGISAKGSASDVFALLTMKKYSIAFTEVPVSQSARLSSLVSGQVDALVSMDPELYQLVAARQARIVLDLSSTFGSQWVPYSVVFTSTSMIQNHSDMLKRVLQGLYNAIAYMVDNPKDAIPLLANFTGSSPEAASKLYNDSVTTMSLTGNINTSSLVQNINAQKLLLGDRAATPALGVMYNGQFLPIRANSAGITSSHVDYVGVLRAAKRSVGW